MTDKVVVQALEIIAELLYPDDELTPDEKMDKWLQLQITINSIEGK